MYFQKDYVLRMIEMMGELIGRIFSMARQADAEAELSEISQRACGLPLKMLLEGDADTLSSLLDDPQRFLAAELIMIQIEILRRAQNDDSLLPYRQQALMLYASLHNPDYILPACDRARTIAEDNLGALSVEALMASASLFERGDIFTAAEDAWYAAAEQDACAKPQALAFYSRLEALPDDALLAGGFTRAEIEEGKQALN